MQQPELFFIFKDYIPRKHWGKIQSLARQQNVTVFNALLNSGIISETKLLTALSCYFETKLHQGTDLIAQKGLNAQLEKIILHQHQVTASLLTPNQNNHDCFQLISPEFLTLSQLKIKIQACRSSQQTCLLTDRGSFRAALENRYSDYFTDQAVNGLNNRFKNASACILAAPPLSQKQKTTGVALTLLSLTVLWFSALPLISLVYAIGLILTPIFICIIILRFWAVLYLLGSNKKNADNMTLRKNTFNFDHFLPQTRYRSHSFTRQADSTCLYSARSNIKAALPVYTILVPLFREERMLESLTKSLQQIDYPKDRLDIKLIMEQDDQKTIDKARSLNLPHYFECLVIPDSQPRTKPKALNYALHFSRGDYLVIYDAEDRPKQDQLLTALQGFRRGPNNLACLQARLNIYNARTNWLTRQFTLEYSTLFQGLLPALSHLNLPFLLGGTSNHFKTSFLKQAGGWDAFNVTEDADLGIRLYRNGYSCATIASTTYEESCTTYSSWLGQRTRWLKGWLQTWCVHMQNPKKLWLDLGARNFLCFQVILGGQILASFCYPVFLLAALTTNLSDLIFTGTVQLQSNSLFLLSFSLVCLGYIMTGWLGVLTLGLQKNKKLKLSALWIPVYWLCISAAAYRAVYQLFTRPFYWEKTDHGHSLTSEKKQ